MPLWKSTQANSDKHRNQARSQDSRRKLRGFTPAGLISVPQFDDIADRLLPVKQNDATAQDDAFPFVRQTRQSNFARFGQRLDAFLQSGRQGAVALKLLLQPRWQPVALGESGRQTRIGVSDTAAQNLAIMSCEDVTVIVNAVGAAAAVIVIIIFVSVICIVSAVTMSFTDIVVIAIAR